MELDTIKGKAVTPGASVRPKIQGQNHADNFGTPPEALKPLIPYLRWRIEERRGARVWECAAGFDPLGQALRSEGFAVHSTDVQSSRELLAETVSGNVDYLDNDLPGFYIAVTNPPFSLKDKFLARAYELERPFAFLLPNTCLEGQKRQDLYARYGIELLVLRRRPKFTTPSGKVGGAWFPCSWFTWGLNLGSPLVFEPAGE
jgi:hypothetical protein